MSDIPKNIGRFPIIDTLGVGGMGVVYSAKDPDIGRQVAIKVLHSTGEKDALERFKNEARTMGEISHPNIVILLEYGIHNNKPFLVMEYLSGLSLGKWIKKKHTLQEHKRILIQLCDAIKFAHNKEILHRDLKPDNIQVLTNGDAKLLDFGIATGQDKGLTATGFFIGTPKYLAPEILEDTTHTKSSDCYSLGLLAYTMLSGENPFAAETFEASMTRILTKIPTPLSQLNPAIPKELSDTIDSYLVKNPNQRPKTPEKLKLVLELIHKPSILNRTIDAKQNIENYRAFEKTVLVGETPKSKMKWIVPAISLFILVITLSFFTQQNLKTQNKQNELTVTKITKKVQPKEKNEVVNTKETDSTETDFNSIKTDKSIATPVSPEPKQLTKSNSNEKSKETNVNRKKANSKSNPTTIINKSKVAHKKTPKAKPTQQVVQRPKKELIDTETKNVNKKPLIAYQKPKKKPKRKPIVQLPSFGQNNKKIPLITHSDIKISRGKTKPIIINLPEGITIKNFKLMRGLFKFTQVEIKNIKQLNDKQIQISLYAQSNAPMGDFSLIGYYNNKKTKPLILEVTL